MSNPSKILVVFGATGNQGGSVIKSVLGDPKTAKEFKIRGITRDASKANAQALVAKGVEMVSADLTSESSLKSALKGAHSVFAITNYWEKMDKDLEIQQGKTVADIAKAAGVQHLIWSSLLNVTKLTNGKFSGVEHFDSKADVEEYIRFIGIPATFFMPGFFMSNIPGSMLMPNPQSEAHEFVFNAAFPKSTHVPLFDAAGDTGKFVKAILLNREKLLGKRVLAATDYYTPDDMIKAFQAAYPKAGKGVQFNQLSEDVYKSILGSAGMPKKVQNELYENMMFMDEFGYYGKASLDESQAILDEKLTSLKDYFAGVPEWKDLE